LKRNEALAILGVAATASLHEIRISYRIKAKASHPDVGGTAEMFDRVTAAYHLLTRLAAEERPSEDIVSDVNQPDQSSGLSRARHDPSLAAFGPVNDPLIRTDQASISRLKP
jgi:hypothetical protein